MFLKSDYSRMEKLESLVVRLEKAVSQLESGRGAGSPPGGSGDTADAVDSVSYKDYNDWIQAYVTPFIELSNKLGWHFFIGKTHPALFQ